MSQWVHVSVELIFDPSMAEADCRRAVRYILLTGFVLLSACGFPAWRNHALREVAEGRWHVNPEQVQGGAGLSQTIEFYDAGGRHIGYGKVQGGTIEFFNVDSSRAGYGRR